MPPDTLAGPHRKAAPPHYPGSRREIITNTNTTSKGALHMTNNEIIYSEVNAKYHTPEQRRAILALAYTPEQIAAKGKDSVYTPFPRRSVHIAVQ